MNGPAKRYDFWWVSSLGVQRVGFKMALELPQSGICGKRYGCFTETVQDGLKTDTLAFKPHFGNAILGITFCVLSESFRRLLDLYKLGF